MAHDHSWVLHPGQSRLPGHMVVVSTSFSADRRVHCGSAAILPNFGAFFLIFRHQSTVWPFSRGMRSVLARERPPACLMDSGGVSRAWPTVHGHSQVRHPGHSGLPGANLRPRRLFGWQTVHLQLIAIVICQNYYIIKYGL